MNDPGATANQKLVVGLGSSHGDDRAGWLVAELLQQHSWQGVEIHIAKSPADLLDWIDGINQLVICDACYGMGQVGDLHRWSWPSDAIADAELSGTHNFSLPTVLELANRLGRLPQEIEIWAIEGRNHSPHADVSPKVREAAQHLADTITRGAVLETWSRPESKQP